MPRRALVTGGSRGIGAAIAAALRQDGHDVVIVDRTIATTGEEGRDHRAYELDVSQFAAVERVLAEVEADGGPIDILVNNAGITRDGMVHKMDPVSQWQAVIDVNLTSAFNTVRCLVPGMRQRGWGRIINISSISGLKGQIGQANYAAAKAGLIGFTKSISLELAGKGICANCVAPGFIESPMTSAMPPDALRREAAGIPVGRLGKPDDIAAIVSFLASDQASFVTGQVWSANGGQYL
ncbi:3-oxoacyl-ACP reductase [Lichenihabitans sp. PAMC28606]|uniref:3-oxoacyl-ACP reductase n=1 Tax=Lichenihabitans sp. PAMC28606 TaxID=2880932 RepID=UPI001D0A4769|nr:3-oxoacyl-ACP reductase [Lichenihabitans sp. PAMC28606]UDL96517.1 3-oxoacyl-ACP reductase [Lichenihabitans sp. PAMC28606]